jgi:hypothetical protein
VKHEPCKTNVNETDLPANETNLRARFLSIDLVTEPPFAKRLINTI